MRRTFGRCATCGKSTRYCATHGCKPLTRNVAVIEAQMHHDAVRLPDGTVHVQNWIAGMYGGLGQHHVHTAAEFAAWRNCVAAKYLKLTDAKHCGCGLAPGQTREYDGKIWNSEATA